LRRCLGAWGLFRTFERAAVVPSRFAHIYVRFACIYVRFVRAQVSFARIYVHSARFCARLTRIRGFENEALLIESRDVRRIGAGQKENVRLTINVKLISHNEQATTHRQHL